MEADKKQKVLEAAKQRFEQFGFKKTGVDEIALEAGISKRTLYEMFESKENILSELVMVEFRTISRIVNKRVKAIEDPLEKIDFYTKFSMKYFRQNTFLGMVLSDDAGLFAPFLQKEIQLIEANIEELFANILTEGIEKGIFRREMNVKGTANCIFTLYRSFTYANTLKINKDWVEFIVNAITKC